MSGLPREAIFQAEGMPDSLAIVSSDMARTSEVMPIMVKIRKEAQAITRATELMRALISF